MTGFARVTNLVKGDELRLTEKQWSTHRCRWALDPCRALRLLSLQRAALVVYSYPMSRGSGKAMRHVLDMLSERPEMSVVELAETYVDTDSEAQPWNCLYIIRRACKKLRDADEITLTEDEKTGKLVARKTPERPPPWEDATAKLDKHFQTKNISAKKKREEEARNFMR